MRGLSVTGTDTGVGKTVVAGAILAALRERGVTVAAAKPVITGLADAADPAWPPDHVLLARAAGCAPETVTSVTFDPPVSPHLAAQLADRPIDSAALLSDIERAALGREVVVIEGVGGLLVPLADRYDVRSLLADLGLPVVVVARAGLGTINHTLLTLEAARAAELDVTGVVLTPWPQQPGEVERSNRATIEQLGQVKVDVLPTVARADPELLAAAGRQLPLDRWLGSLPSRA